MVRSTGMHESEGMSDAAVCSVHDDPGRGPAPGRARQPARRAGAGTHPSRSEAVRRAIELYLYRLACEQDARQYERLPLADAELSLADDPDAWSDTPTSPGGRTYETKGEQRRDWLRHLLRAISELNGVAGNHARSYFEMAPASIVLRLSDSLVAGYDLYAFRPDGTLPEIVGGILEGDYPGGEFYLGGKLVRDHLDAEERTGLEGKGVRLFRMANQVLDAAAQEATGSGFLSPSNGTH
jgi:hypothetical protein